MKDIRDDWFFSQHYTEDEMNKLWEYIVEGGTEVHVKQTGLQAGQVFVDGS